MNSSIPTTKASAEKGDLPLQPPFAATPAPARRNRHHHHHCDASAFPGTNTNADNKESTATNFDTNGTALSPIGADTGHNSVVSGRSRTRRSRRSTAAKRIGAAFDLLGDGAQDGLTICCDGVSVRQGNCNIIDDVFCLFRGGRVTAVVNCCGTHSALALLAAVAGRVDCTAGNILVNGVPVSASSYQAQMSFVGERSALADVGGATGDLLAELTVRENLEYASALRVANSAQAYSVEEMLQQLLLEPHAHAPIRNCSLYVRRRVALGKQLLLNPSVLLLDGAMDDLATHEAQQFLTILLKLAAPSAADAQARLVMRDAMAAAAATSLLGEAGVSASTNASTPPTVSDRISLYTPRHSRLYPGDDRSSFVSSPSSSAVPLPLTSAQHNGNRSTSSSAGQLPGALLRNQTQRVIVLSVMQPRWALLQYVHDVVLLERSRCVFAGTVRDMLSVKLPRAVLRSPMTHAADGPAAARSGDDDDDVDHRLGRSPTPIGVSLLADDAPADSYDAVAASIQRTRLNEEFVHGLYRLATTTAVSTGGVVASVGLPTVGSFTSSFGASELWGSDPPSGSRHSPSASLMAVRVDDVYPTPLSQLYATQFGHTRAQVTAYMEVCAAGLLSLPEASHQAPSSFTQLYHLFRFGFVELRHNLLFSLIALVLMLAGAAALAALYGVQVGDRGIQNCAGILFFLVCCVVLQALLSLDTQRRDYASFYRYSRNGYYAAGTFLVYRAVTAALWRFGLMALVALVIFLLSNFGEPWREYRSVFELGVILAVLSYCCHFLIWFLCAWWPSNRVGRFLVYSFYTLNAVLGGLVLNLATLPPAVRGVSFASVMRLAYESSILTNFADKTFGCDKGNSSGSSSTAHTRSKGPHHSFSKSRHETSFTSKAAAAQATSGNAHAWKGSQGILQDVQCYTGADYIAYMGFESSRRWPNVCILTGLSGALLFASWIMMVLYRPRRRLKITG
ncbi:hypothetical protein ABL78_1844 [Leptomonas seymouri]|uniref:ABC transporter domain-containing protein n=1 Tax=Leptomonas seymouri TaxID=5684 RepID=A0A0N1I8B6_LEPSE|nr:hypothetical protein ABL78_1844 [Leptomonas seymouri]|eukprot:KPI89031.1 hypothetical protein ABL78_1844 [Leptomonas seymouri]